MSNQSVRPFMRVVAAGQTENGLPRLTLIATPEPAANGAAGSFPLSEWPRRMATLIAKGIVLPGSALSAKKFGVQVAAAPRTESILQNNCWTAAEPDISKVKFITAFAKTKDLGDPEAPASIWVDINAIWQEAFKTAGGAQDPWVPLGTLIEGSLAGNRFNVAPTDNADVAKLHDKGRGQMRALETKPSDTITIKTVVPARQSDLAFHLEVERARRVAAGLREPSTDAALLLLEQAATPTADPSKLTPDALLEELRKKKEAELKDAVQATETDRKLAKKTFEQAQAKLTGRLCGPCEPQSLCTQNPSTAMAETGVAAAKTQQYGSWAQARQPETANTKAAESLERIAQTFYAFQGDPGFARLFCLAVDLEISETANLDPYTFLAVEADEPDRVTPRVWTTAKTAGKHFWPAPKDEIDIPEEIQTNAAWEKPVLELINNLDQYDGLSLTGAGFSSDSTKNNPRFGLVSLDMRRAAEPVGTESITEAAVKPRALHTAGLIVIDRLRADEAIRTAARTATQKSAKPVNGEKRPRALLYAEDLTTGKRLDVAISKGGSDRWRSLMARTVRYDFRIDRVLKPTVSAALDKLIGKSGTEARREIDAASIIFASRLVPRGTSGADTDAVVEEAVAQWDGTPMAVLCAQERPISSDDASAAPLPFRRTLGLPDAKSDPGSRPPPLRYGSKYRFAMRSVFLGGRAISLKEDGSHLKRNYETTKIQQLERLLAFPARLENQPMAASLKRFLRQEAVGRPDILLPSHIAVRDNKPMGFEQADRVVLRANNSDPVSGSDFIAGAPYVPAARRAAPLSTMRIIVPPTISQDEAMRHGMLDGIDLAQRLKGGLLDVRRDRQITDTQDPLILRPVGFPMAVTQQPVGFGTTPAEQARALVYRGPAEEQGEAVFVAGTDLGERQPFLPDPAAERYVLRVRNRATGAFLKGSLEVTVYDGGLAKWPNAVPLAVVMTQVKKRPRPMLASDVLAIAKAPDQKLSAAGILGKAGARVKVIEMNVGPAEDYELIAFCLPSPERLAQWFALPETLGALIGPMGSEISCKSIENIFGKAIAESLEKCSAMQPASKDDCNCSTGGHVGASGDWLLEIAKILSRHATGIRPIDELAAVAAIRVACASSRPAAGPGWMTKPLPKDFDKAVAAVEWVGANTIDEHGQEALFGKASAFRPAKSSEQGGKTSDAWAIAKDLLRPTTVKGSKDYLLAGAISIDLTDADGFEIVAETVAPRNSLIDDTTRRRSSKARRSGRWPSMLDEAGKRRFSSVLDVYGFGDIGDDGRVTLARSQVTLLRCEALPIEGSAPLWPQWAGQSTISLAMVHEAARRGALVASKAVASTVDPAANGTPIPRLMFKSDQVHTFPDSKARRLLVKAVAFSRFAADWETADRWLGPSDGTRPELARRQPLNRMQQIRESEPMEVWLPASERPAKCVVRSPMPVLRTSRHTKSDQGLNVYAFERGSVTRIYLSRGWFSSGEGERLGIVIWPPNHLDDPKSSLSSKLEKLYGRPVKLDELSDEFLGPGGGFITRWGGDPIRWDSTPDTDPLIGPKNFADIAHLIQGVTDTPLPPDVMKRLKSSPHAPRIVKDVQMPIGIPPAEKPSQTAAAEADVRQAEMTVSLITYEPCFDADREEWFVDVEITPSKSTDPFVRFGLVRYQENAPPELQVSEPVVAWSQILPHRTANITPVRDNDGALTIFARVSGQASEKVKHHRRDQQTKQPIYDLLDKPHMRMTVVHERKDSSDQWKRTLIDAADFHAADTSPHIENGVATWSLAYSIDPKRLAALGQGRFYAYLDEVEQRMPATYPTEPISPNDMFNPATLVDSGPRFSARIPFDVPLIPDKPSTENELAPPELTK